MLRKLAAALLVAGLVLPYGCDTTPITILWTAWGAPADLVSVGVPLLLSLVYALVALVPPAARLAERHGPALHGVGRALFFILAGVYLHAGLTGEGDAWPFWVAALVLNSGLLYWQQQRASKAERLPLLVLVSVGLPAVYYFLALLDSGDLAVGGWVFTAGYLLGVAGEVGVLRRAATITHGG